MFCPICGANITLAQKFCRGCGLRLEKIAEEIALQLPTQTHADQLRRAVRCEKFGVAALIIFGFIIVFGVLFLSIFGLNLKPLGWVSGIAIFIMFACGFLAMFFFNYATHLREKVSSPGFRDSYKEFVQQKTTTNLLEEKPFEPASVTEHTTELLYAEKPKKIDETG